VLFELRAMAKCRLFGVPEVSTLLGNTAKRPNFGDDSPCVPAHCQRVLCPAPNSHGLGLTTFEFQKLVESGTVPSEERFSGLVLCQRGE
jgi:hypothetical protein